MRQIVLIACGALMLVSPGSASAARAEVVRTDIGEERSRKVFSTVHFDAAPGERNALTVTLGSGDVVLRDDGAKIEPGPRCTAIDDQAVRCVHVQGSTVNGIVQLVELRLGDEDDAFSGSDRGCCVSADGGDGNDVLEGSSQLSGGAGDDVLKGGPGGARLTGGPGRDTLRGGSGPDILVDGDSDEAPARDVVDGGAGTDLVSYEGRTAPVSVDLAGPSAGGATGEGDSVTAIENIRGGSGADALHGDGGPNAVDGGSVNDSAGDLIEGRGGADRLTGSSGDDDIDGGDGNDDIHGVEGADRLSGGPGNDHLDVMLDNRGTDEIGCGSGRDVVSDPIATHVIPVDCETIWLLTAKVSPVRGGPPGGQSFRVRPFTRNQIHAPCARLQLGDPAGSLGSVLFSMPKSGNKHVRVPLTPRGRRKVRPGARVRVRFVGYYDCRRGARPSDPASPGSYTFVR